MTRLKPFAAFAFLLSLVSPSLAQADDYRGFDRNGTVERRWSTNRPDIRTDRGWERNYRENERYWNQSYNRGYDRYRDRPYYTGYEPHYYPSRPNTTIIVTRPTAYDRPLETRTIIYGNGGYTAVPQSNVIYYGYR